MGRDSWNQRAWDGGRAVTVPRLVTQAERRAVERAGDRLAAVLREARTGAAMERLRAALAAGEEAGRGR